MTIPRAVAPDMLLEGAGASFGDRVAELVNQERWNNGALPPLKHNDLLDNAASGHSTSMGNRNFFAHCDPDTKTLPWDRMSAAGYNWNYAAENIATGYSTPEAVMAAWMNSSGHRSNILSTNAYEIGIGYYLDSADTANVRLDQNGDCLSDGFNGPFSHYWTQNFGRRNQVFPLVIEREGYRTDNHYVDLYLYGSAWATQMRLHNESGTWTPWQAFTADVAGWQLSAGDGLKEVFVELRNSVGTTLSASDTIWLYTSTGTFIDVPQSYWAYAEIEKIAAAGITQGCGGSKYCPGNPVTRAQMAIFLLRGIHGSTYSPPPATGTLFSDVPKSAFAAAWIEQFATEGITQGCGDGKYCSENPVTRAQMAIFLLRTRYGAAYTPPPATGTVFSDVPKSAFAAAWIEQLVKEGITGGCGAGKYCPNNSVNRAQMAVFLVRTFKL